MIYIYNYIRLNRFYVIYKINNSNLQMYKQKLSIT